MTHVHKPIDALTEIRVHTGTIAISEENVNRAAHGNVTERYTCECGAKQSCNLNGQHVEFGPWDLPDWAADELQESPKYTGKEAKRYLRALVASEIGCEAIVAIFCDLAKPIIDKPDGCDDASAIKVVRMVGMKLVELRAELRRKAKSYYFPVD